METEHVQAAGIKPGRRSWGSSEMQALRKAVDCAAQNALAQRRANGDTMTYQLDSWMVREFPGMHIERLCPVDEFTVEKFPHPGFTPPQH